LPGTRHPSSALPCVGQHESRRPPAQEKQVTTEHFLPEHVYDRLALELEALAVQQGARGPLDPKTWAVEFLSLAGVWPDSVKPALETA
jgi:hypothetical protein